MQKNPPKTPGRIFLSKSKNRPYLPDFPIQIVHAEFYLDLKLQKKVMKLCIRNDSDRAVTALTVYARYLDRENHLIGVADGHIVWKFSNIYCAAHKTALSSKTIILPYQDIARVEACLGSVTWEDGETKEFSADDSLLSPEQDMLENRLSESAFSLLQNRFGSSCVFVPAQISASEHRWLCACGAVSDAEVCTVCGMNRHDAMRLCDPDKARPFLFRLRLRRIAIRSLPYAAAVLLLSLGVVWLSSSIHRYIHVTLPADRLSVTEKLMQEHRYEEALGYSTAKNNRLLYDEIVTEAVLYYCEIGNYTRALEFEQCRETPDYESVYAHAANAFLRGTDANCLSVAMSTADTALRDQVLRKLAEEAYAAGNLADACAIALHMTEESSTEYTDTLLYEQIAALLEDGDYEDAVTYINHLHDTGKVVSVCNGIEKELLSRGHYDDAFSIAELTGDTSVFAEAYASVTESTLRRYYDQFFPYMSQEDRRNFLASALSATDDSLTVIQNETAQNSRLGVLAANAVSTASGDAHILVLTRDGTVYAFGSNNLGQCDCNGVQDVLAVAAGGNHSVLLMTDGTVRAYGDNAFGQSEVSAWNNVIEIAAGKRHTAALLQDGTVVACGSNGSGQCNLSAYRNVVGLAAGEYSTVLIFRAGNVIAEGNLSLETTETRTWKNIVRVSAGNSHLLALSANGRVLVAGHPEYEEITQDQLSDWSRIQDICCSERAVFALNANTKILFCGSEIPDLTASGWESLIQ